MISIDTTRRSQGEWHALVEQFHDVSIMQLWEYGHVKEQLQGWEVVHHVFSENGTIIGIAQGVVRRLPILR
ncbi:MAG: hypothetical protein Q7T01_01205, partial [bacterium]|nr:hypothetical protein [bacterium]